MKKLLTILFAAALIINCYQTSSNANTIKDYLTMSQIDTTSQHLIYKGKLVEIYVEKAIFHSSTNNNFLMKFSIKNIGDKAIGVDLTDYWKVIYPNQWGIYKKPYREVVNEEQIIPDTIFNKTEIFKKFEENYFTLIKPKETSSYYRDWNGSGEKIELDNKEEFFIITLDGQLLLTNGEELENITLNEADEKKRAIIFSYPILFKSISEKEIIIKHN